MQNHSRERYVYKVPMANGVPTVQFNQDADEIFTFRPDGTYITDRLKPQLEQKGIRATPWNESTMRVINQGPALKAPAPAKPAKAKEEKKSSRKGRKK